MNNIPKFDNPTTLTSGMLVIRAIGRMAHQTTIFITEVDLRCNTVYWKNTVNDQPVGNTCYSRFKFSEGIGGHCQCWYVEKEQIN